MGGPNCNAQTKEGGREFRIGGSAPNADHQNHIVTAGPVANQLFLFKSNEEDTPMFPGSQSLQSEKFKSFSQKLKQVDQ